MFEYADEALETAQEELDEYMTLLEQMHANQGDVFMSGDERTSPQDRLDASADSLTNALEWIAVAYHDLEAAEQQLYDAKERAVSEYNGLLQAEADQDTPSRDQFETMQKADMYIKHLDATSDVLETARDYAEVAAEKQYRTLTLLGNFLDAMDMDADLGGSPRPTDPDGDAILEAFYSPEQDVPGQPTATDPQETEAALMEEFGRDYEEYGFSSYDEMAEHVQDIVENPDR